jgi:hypothetical protein
MIGLGLSQDEEFPASNNHKNLVARFQAQRLASLTRITIWFLAERATSMAVGYNRRHCTSKNLSAKPPLGFRAEAPFYRSHSSSSTPRSVFSSRYLTITGV